MQVYKDTQAEAEALAVALAAPLDTAEPLALAEIMGEDDALGMVGTLADPLGSGALTEPLGTGTLAETLGTGMLAEALEMGKLADPLGKGALALGRARPLLWLG